MCGIPGTGSRTGPQSSSLSLVESTSTAEDDGRDCGASAIAGASEPRESSGRGAGCEGFRVARAGTGAGVSAAGVSSIVAAAGGSGEAIDCGSRSAATMVWECTGAARTATAAGGSAAAPVLSACRSVAVTTAPPTMQGPNESVGGALESALATIKMWGGCAVLCMPSYLHALPPPLPATSNAACHIK